MPDGLQAVGAQKDPSRSAPLNMSTYISGLITQQNPMAGGAVPYIQQKFYSATRYDRLLGGKNCELSVRLSIVRAPGSSRYNSAAFSRPNRACSFKPFINGVEDVHVMLDTPGAVYDGTGPNRQLNIWNKSAGAGKTQFQPVGNELFFANGIDAKKWVLSQLIWEASTLYDGAATSDATLGDFIVDPNGNIQQAVGGFTLLISNVSLTGNVLTLTLNTSQLADPTGTPTGVAATTGGNLPAGSYYTRVCAVDPTGNVTEAGNESAAVLTTGATSQIAWTWPAISGAAGYRVYIATAPGGETTFFTTATNSFTQTATISTMTGTPPIANVTSVEVPDNLFQMVGVKLALSGLTTATWLNGQTITITGVLPGGQASNQITATFAHADYASTPDSGTATSGSGISGAAPPAWQTALWAVTQDGGAQWINRSSYVQNWGITTPASAPTIFQNLAPTGKYLPWTANTFYWPSRCTLVTIGGVGYIFLLTATGTTGSAPPAWNTSAIGVTTPDNTAVWAYEGPAEWSAGATVAKGAYTTFQPATGGLQVYIALNAGVTGVSQSGWGSGVGALLQDGSVTWQCLGTIIPYTSAGAVTTSALLQWPTTGDLSFRESFTIEPSEPNVVLYNLPLGTSMQVGGSVTITGCASGAMNGTGTILQSGIALPYTSGYGISVRIPFTAGSYHPWNDQAGGSVAYTPPSAGLTPLVNVAANSQVLDSNGYIEQVQDPGGFSGQTAPTWGAEGALTQELLSASITAFAIASGTATLTAANDFPPGGGIQVTTSGLAVATYLNGTWTLLSATPTQFTIATTHADITTTSDNGTATVPGGAKWVNVGPYAPVSTQAGFYVYAYGNSVTKHVGSASMRSAAVSLSAGYLAAVQGFGSADPQVDTIWIFRTAQGGAVLLLVDKIANPGGGVPWTYNDQVLDTGLNTEISAPMAGVNNPPPPGFLPSAYHLGRIWGFVGNVLWYSDGPDALIGSGLEAFSPQNYFVMPETITKLRATSIGLLIYGTANVYIQTGLGTSASPFIPPPMFQEGVGLLSYDAECVNGSTAYLMTSARRVISFDPGAGELEVGFFIGDQFAEGTTFDPATAYLTFHEGSSEDLALYVADGSTGWFRMGVLGAPETGNVWSPFRAIVGGCGMVQSVEVAPGVKTLLIGANESGPILARDYAVRTDNGTPYPMNLILGSMMLCQPGSEALVDFITLDSLKLGTRPTVGLLLGELSGYESSPPFITLTANRNDLPLLPAPKTLYSDRYDMAQNQNQQSCRHLQMRIDWAAEAVATELLTHTVFGTLQPEA